MTEQIQTVLNKIDGAKSMALTNLEQRTLEIVEKWVIQALEETKTLEREQTK